MDHEFTDYLNSFCGPWTPEVMGRVMRPFSLYHQHWLQLIQSPFMQQKGAATLFDLEIASRICACDYGEAANLAKKRMNFLEKLGWCLRALTTDVPAQAERFQKYVLYHVKIPKMWGSPEGQGVAYSFPDVLAVVGTLTRAGYEGGDQKKIWMTPVAVAHWTATAIRRDEGCDIQLITPQDEALMEHIRAQREAEKQEELARQHQS